MAYPRITPSSSAGNPRKLSLSFPAFRLFNGLDIDRKRKSSENKTVMFSFCGYAERRYRVSDRPRSHDRISLPSEALDPSKLRPRFAGDRIGSIEYDVGATRATAIVHSA